jgi:hypothetical protein
MKKLAVALSIILILGIVGAGVLAKSGKAKSYGQSKNKYGEDTEEGPNGNGKAWGKGGNPNKPGGPEMEAEDEEQEEQEGEEEEVESQDQEEEAQPTPRYPADYNGLYKTRGRVRHLYLYPKDPTTWYPVEGGAWGKMTYRPSGQTFRYTLSAHGLEPGQEYCLIYYPDGWPGNGLICLGRSTAKNGGNLHISDRRGIEDLPDLPVPEDENYPSDPQNPESGDGAKIWLVLSEDVDCDNQLMIGWNPTEYLFEYDLIFYDGPQEAATTEESEPPEESETTEE